jgi:hypothetical protein
MAALLAAASHADAATLFLVARDRDGRYRRVLAVRRELYRRCGRRVLGDPYCGVLAVVSRYCWDHRPARAPATSRGSLRF